MENWYSAPKKKDYKGKNVEFTVQAYNAWAFEMVKEHIATSKKNLIDALEDFRAKVDDYACRAKTEDARLIFACAYDVVTDILDDQILRNNLKRKAKEGRGYVL